MLMAWSVPIFELTRQQYFAVAIERDLNPHTQARTSYP